VLPGHALQSEQSRFVRSNVNVRKLPANDDQIAFASVSQLSRWIETRQLTSERLTNIYLERIARHDSRLHCVITLTRELRCDKQSRPTRRSLWISIAAVAWYSMGAKDLLDTAGIATTYGAEPFRGRIPTRDAVVVSRLHEAGAVLIAKLSLVLLR